MHDLTPELRTRLSRVEKTVGWFISIATIILLAGFIYYVYSAAKSRGWFVTKLNFATGLNDASGFAVGNPVKLMGFDVGDITGVQPNSADQPRGVTVFFRIRDPYWGYIWWDSRVRVASDFLGHRYLEVEKGKTGQPSVYTDTNSGDLMVLNRYVAWKKYTELSQQLKQLPENKGLPEGAILPEATSQLMELLKTQREVYYTNALKAKYTVSVDPSLPPEARNYYWMPPIDAPSLSARLDALAGTVEHALPNILQLTNQLAAVLSNANAALFQVNNTLAQTHPTLTNLALITDHLRDPNGSLGNWILSTNLAGQLQETLQAARATLDSAHATIDTTDTNLTVVATDLDHTLQHLSDLTSNLAWQVQANTNLVTEISRTITHTDDLVQGLKREWFLRSAFKKKKP